MQHYTIHLFLENCSTCFGWYLLPSSGAHNFIYTIWYLLTVMDKNKVLILILIFLLYAIVSYRYGTGQ